MEIDNSKLKVIRAVYHDRRNKFETLERRPLNPDDKHGYYTGYYHGLTQVLRILFGNNYGHIRIPEELD